MGSNRPSKYRSWRLSVALLLVLQWTRPAAAAWPHSVPEDQGVDSQQLGKIFDAVQARHIPVHSVLVIRNGRAVLDADFYPYSNHTPHDLASMTKSVVATLIGIAIDRGVLSANQRVLDLFPERRFANVDDQKRQMTVEHLLTMTSGLCAESAMDEQLLSEQRRASDWLQFALDRPLVSRSGQHFAYCSQGSNVLSAVLTRATGMTAEAFARRYLYEPLGIGRVIWPKDPQGNGHGWGDTYMLPEDMAKIGHLYLQHGEWNGRRVLSSGFVAEATRQHVRATPNDGYGYQWWLTAPPERYEARGRGGQRIVVIPSLNTVIVMLGTARFEPGEIGALLLAAFKSDGALPRNNRAYQALLRKIAGAKRAPDPDEVTPLPARAGQVSGRTFELADNPYGLSTVRVTFSDARRGVLRYSLSEPMNRYSATHDTPFRMDGVYAMSNTSLIHDLPTGARGRWTSPEDFELELNMAGFNHIMRFIFHFGASPKALQLIDQSMYEGTIRLEMRP